MPRQQRRQRHNVSLGWRRVASGGVGWRRVASSGGVGWPRVASGGLAHHAHHASSWSLPHLFHRRTTRSPCTTLALHHALLSHQTPRAPRPPRPFLGLFLISSIVAPRTPRLLSSSLPHLFRRRTTLALHHARSTFAPRSSRPSLHPRSPRTVADLNSHACNCFVHPCMCVDETLYEEFIDALADYLCIWDRPNAALAAELGV